MRDLAHFLEAVLAAPMVAAVWSSGESFHNLARRFTARFDLPGTGILAFPLTSDLWHMKCSIFWLEKSNDPRGSIHDFEFQTIVPDVDATISLRPWRPAFWRTTSERTLSVKRCIKNP